MGLAILFFGLGVIFLAMELFFPSFGILSLSAAASFVGAVVLAFQESRTAGLVFLGSMLVVIPTAIWFGLRILPGTRVGRRIVLRPPPSRAESGESGGRVEVRLVGREGISRSELRPAGAIEIDGSRYDAVTSGEYIEPGRRVHVLRHEGNRIVVEEVPGSGDSAPQEKKPRWA